MKDRVLRIMSHVLGVPPERLDDQASPDTVESWDSLNHMNMVLALEEEFGIQFGDDQIVKLLTVAAIAAAVAERSPAGS